MVRVPTIERVNAMLKRSERCDAFATNKSILFEISDGLPGSKVLDGRYGLEQLALGIPKGRDSGLPYARSFVAAAVSSGLGESRDRTSGPSRNTPVIFACLNSQQEIRKFRRHFF